MARQSASARKSGSTATKNVPGNQTPNTPEINESEIARLKVDQLRGRLRRRGITGTSDMRKDELVAALIKALREGRKTTRARSGSGSRDNAGPRGGSGSRRSTNSSDSGPGRSGAGSRSRGGGAGARGSASGKEQPGNQTPNTPDINESEIARLKVDQLRGRLRRRGVTGTSDMRKDELVAALIKALREGRKTTRAGSGGTAGGGSASGGSRAGSTTSRRSVPDAERGNTIRTPDVAALPAATAHAELEAAPAPAALPAAPAHAPEQGHTRETRAEVRIPRPRTAPDDLEATRRQPVRSSGPADGESTGSGQVVTVETADRVLADLVPAEMEPVDEVVTPEGTVITGGVVAAEEAVATPPLPTTDNR